MKLHRIVIWCLGVLVGPAAAQRMTPQEFTDRITAAGPPRVPIMIAGIPKPSWEFGRDYMPAACKVGILPTLNLAWPRNEEQVRETVEWCGGTVNVYDSAVIRRDLLPGHGPPVALALQLTTHHADLDNKRETVRKWREWGVTNVRLVACDHLTEILLPRATDETWNRLLETFVRDWRAFIDQEFPGVTVVVYDDGNPSTWPGPRFSRLTGFGQVLYRTERVATSDMQIDKLRAAAAAGLPLNVFLSLGMNYDMSEKWGWTTDQVTSIRVSRFWGRMFASDPVLSRLDAIVLWPTPWHAELNNLTDGPAHLVNFVEAMNETNELSRDHVQPADARGPAPRR